MQVKVVSYDDTPCITIEASALVILRSIINVLLAIIYEKNRESIIEMTELTGPHRFQMDDWLSCAPFEKLLHMQIIEASEGNATLEMPFLFEFAQGSGLITRRAEFHGLCPWVNVAVAI